MLAGAIRTAAAGREIPADIESISRFSDWRQRVWWPVSILEANDIATAQARQALTWTESLDDAQLRDAALLALPNILGYGRALLLHALAINRAASVRARLCGAAPELAYIQSGEGKPPTRGDPIMPFKHTRFELVRRVARIHSWTGPARFMQALLLPGAVAISHNPLLVRTAAAQKRRLGFRHAESIIAAARVRVDTVPSVADQAASGAQALVPESILPEPYRGRLTALLECLIDCHLTRALRDMQGMRALRLPDQVWSGSGGPYAPRAVGLEVLRRGGPVVRLDHGTPRGFVGPAESSTILELAVSSDFLLATKGAADICRSQNELALPPVRRTVTIEGLDGDPAYARISASRRSGRSERPRVVYVPTQILGFRQLLPVQQPDVVHLNWQMQVAEALRDLPVDFICQAHPEGYFKGQPHPIEAVAPTMRGNFGAQLEAADVFVFDYPSTTALWEAACTGAQIVFLDIGSGTITPKVDRLLRKRARVIDVVHDEANRPILDVEALADAVLSAPREVDPMPLRRLLAGTH